MCGRIVQKSGSMDYVERLFPNPRRIFSDPAGPDYNIPPGKQPLAMHQLAGEFEVERLPWGWRPTTSKYLMSNARLDKILAGAWPWKMLIGRGRILVPADGWYEWKPLGDGPKPPKQPYFIHAKDNAPPVLRRPERLEAGRRERRGPRLRRRHQRRRRRDDRRSRPPAGGAISRPGAAMDGTRPTHRAGGRAALARATRNSLHLAPRASGSGQFQVQTARRRRTRPAYAAGLTLS